MALFATGVIEACKEIPVLLNNLSKGYVTIRVGLHTGSVVATVIGRKNPKYTLLVSAMTVVMHAVRNDELQDVN